MICHGNTTKSAPGDTPDCSADQPCDGTTNVPNTIHTACGEKNRTFLRHLYDILFHVSHAEIRMCLCLVH